MWRTDNIPTACKFCYPLHHCRQISSTMAKYCFVWQRDISIAGQVWLRIRIYSRVKLNNIQFTIVCKRFAYYGVLKIIYIFEFTYRVLNLFHIVITALKLLWVIIICQHSGDLLQTLSCRYADITYRVNRWTFTVIACSISKKLMCLEIYKLTRDER